MEEWKEYRLGDFMEFNPKISLKKDTVARKITMDQLVPHSRDIYSGTYEPYSGGAKFQNGDTIMARITPCLENGKHAFISLLDENEIAYGSTEYIVIRGRKGISDNLFVYYLTHFPSFKDAAIKSMVGTSGRQRAQVDVLENLTMKLPSIAEQKSIADILTKLDDKIAVNKQINDNFCYAIFEVLLIWLVTSIRNDNLEQQAQALFKSWFVDFEPFRGQPFVESELGMIPQGWRVGRYEEIIETTISGDWGKEKPEGNYVHKVACIRGCDFQDIKNGLRGNTPERYILEKNYQSKHFHHNDVLVEISGGTQTVSTGRVCPVSQLMIDKFNADIVCTNFCRVIRPIAAYAAYLYYSWLYKYNGKVMFGYENGTSGIKNFRIKDFISVEPVVIPPADLLGKFQQFVDSVQLQIQTRGSESSRLASLRDTLLPRLMSGEIKVGDVTL